MQSNTVIDIARRSNAHVANNLKHLPPEFSKAAGLFALQQVAKHGLDPSTKPQAAAHEAGHLVVALALGGAFVRARLHKNPDGTWGGYNECFVAGIHTPGGETFAVTEQPGRAFWLAVILAGGISGEKVAGLHHPASSPDEIIKLNGIAGAAGFNVGQVIITTLQIIMANRGVFDSLRGLLTTKRRIFKEDIERLLPKVVMFPITDVEVAA